MNVTMSPALAKTYDFVQALNRTERRDLFKLIKNDLEIEERKIDIETYENKLIATIEKTLGCPMDYDSRKFPFTTARQLIAWQAMNDGFSSTTTAKIMHKNHTTIIWMRDKVNDMMKYPFGYDKELEFIKRFKQNWNDVQ